MKLISNVLTIVCILALLIVITGCAGPGKKVETEPQAVPAGRSYLLSDAEADGILDFAREENKKATGKIDIELLDQMQEKYTWIIGLIKKHYKN